MHDGAMSAPEVARDQVLELAASAPLRLYSVKMTTHDWLDPRGLRRFERTLAGEQDETGADPPRITGDQSAGTSASLTAEGFSQIRFLYPDGGHESPHLYPNDLPVDWGPKPMLSPGPVPPQGNIGWMFSPLVAELLAPADLLSVLDLDVTGRVSYLGREAACIRGTATWTTDDCIRFANLTPADEYRAVVDVESGILLRITSVIDGYDYAGHEVTYLDVEYHDTAWDRPPR